MKKVHISFLHNLEHIEFKIFYSSLLRLMQEKQFVDPTLTELLERLQSHQKDVKSLKRGALNYKNTNTISELSRLRTDYLISFRLEIKSKMLWYKPDMRVAAERLHTWLKHYKKKPFIQSISTQDKVVDSMLWRIAKDKSLKADIALLDLDKLLDVIDKTTQQIANQVSQRANEKMSRQKKGKDIRDAAYSVVKTLANYLEYKVSLIDGNVAESEHYILLLKMHKRLVDIRRDFRIRTAKDKTRRAKIAAAKQLKAKKDAELNQLKATNMPDCESQNRQARSTKTTSTEIFNKPGTNQSLTDNDIKAPIKITPKQKEWISKPKMNRRKIRNLLV